VGRASEPPATRPRCARRVSLARAEGPRHSTAGCSRSAAPVADERRTSSDYRWARQVAALLLIGVVVVIVVLDVLVDDYDVNTGVLVPLLLTVAGLLSVDLPRLRG
jgi:hypothetical protein